MVSNENHSYYFHDKGVSTDQFVRQLRILKFFYEIISLNEAIRMSSLGQSLAKKLVITFDDGFRECNTIVAPILLEEKVTSTFFLLGDCLNNNNLMWRNKLLVINDKLLDRRKLLDDVAYEFDLKKIGNKESVLNWSGSSWPMNLKEDIVNVLWEESGVGSLKSFMNNYKPYLLDTDVEDLIDNGFDIGSHSMTHPFFSKLDYKQCCAEIVDSVEIIENRYQVKVQSFSYPFGDRSRPEFESRFIQEHNNIKTFLGIKNSLNNYQDCSSWERDNLEFNNNSMIFMLAFLPTIRRCQSKLAIKKNKKYTK